MAAVKGLRDLCPDPLMLAGYASGQLFPEHEKRIGVHLLQCAACNGVTLRMMDDVATTEMFSTNEAVHLLEVRPCF